jgi:hypothetical protein
MGYEEPTQPGAGAPSPGAPPPGGPPGGYGGGPGYGGYGGFGRGMGMGMRMGGMRRPTGPIETKPFLLTSEFWFLLFALIALLITTLTNDTIDAWRFWILTTILLGLYMLSRGIAKSGTRSRAWDPREDIEPRGGGGEHHRP